MIFVNLFWVLPLALISNSFNDFHILVTIIAYLPLLLYLIKIGAGLEVHKGDNEKKILY